MAIRDMFRILLGVTTGTLLLAVLSEGSREGDSRRYERIERWVTRVAGKQTPLRRKRSMAAVLDLPQRRTESDEDVIAAAAG